MDDKTKDLLTQLAKGAIQVGREISPYIIVGEIYKRMFTRKASDPLICYHVSDFPELQADSYRFVSNKGQFLQGYMYYYNGNENKTIVVFAHGYGGGGHKTYLNVIEYLARNGFLVFAYDVTGNDESEGESIGGFPQGIIDVTYAINFVKSLNKYRGLPICLCGHSWGAYSVSNAPNWNPDIKAVVALSGFNEPASIMKAHASDFGAESQENVMRALDTYDAYKWGQWGESTSVQALGRTNAKVLIVHSEDDRTVPITCGYNVYYKEYKNNPRFTFIKYRNKGHGTIYMSTEGKKYYDRLITNYKKFCKKKNVTQEEKEKFINENLDRNKWLNLLDESLMKEIVGFLRNEII